MVKYTKTNTVAEGLREKKNRVCVTKQYKKTVHKDSGNLILNNITLNSETLCTGQLFAENILF